ncbi:hypothetical protein [Pleomorphomonas sp. T1.2MG-36]|uniref:hypothetical protein n=1 Tax=Pleomorphomonas sp. T1.2MG-36 TaxID=3041167 RepID=UPI00254068D0|nr:hypothetical protein [Pleomorphomonas sp. T1.2MG-36]
MMEFDSLFTEAFLASDENLPRIGQSPASFGGQSFHYGVEAPDRAGVYILIFEYRNHLHPLYVGYGRSIRAAIGDVLSERDALHRLAHGFYWKPVASEADGRRLVERLIMALRPHFNTVDLAACGREAAEPPREVTTRRVETGLIGEAERTTAQNPRSWRSSTASRPFQTQARPTNGSTPPPAFPSSPS